MIQKTLTITVVEKDEVTGEPHYNVRLYRGPSAGKLIIEPLINGKFVVDEADLFEASNAFKEFYITEEKEVPKKLAIKKSSDPVIVSIPDNIPERLNFQYGEDDDV